MKEANYMNFLRDVVNDEGDVEEVATTPTTFNRVPWLAS